MYLLGIKGRGGKEIFQSFLELFKSLTLEKMGGSFGKEGVVLRNLAAKN
jgi:hypothetical protein